MPWYNDLRPNSDDNKQNFALIFPDLKNSDRKRILEQIIDLRAYLDTAIPAKRTDDNLLLSSWNIKEFGNSSERLADSYFFMAEIISRFDLVAIQEVKKSLKDLKILMKLLGSQWKYVITDVTEGNAGNRERFAYIYDSRRVESSGLSGEIVLWDDITEGSSIKQLKRTPAITGFKCGWKSFSIINVHFHPSNGTDDREYRREEIRLLLDALAEKERKGHLWSKNIILLGDTNLYKNNSQALDLIQNFGFIETIGLKDKNTNVSDSEIYDRIFLRVNEFFKVIEDHNHQDHRVVDFFDHIMKDSHRPLYDDIMRFHKEDPGMVEDEKLTYYYNRYWKRNQMSDHLPVWIEIESDSSGDFLAEKLQLIKGLEDLTVSN